MGKIKKIAVIGFGQRGHIYGSYAFHNPNKYKLVAIAEVDDYRRKVANDKYKADVYQDYKELLDFGYDLDLVAICTQDVDHKEHAIYALNKGYNLLLEKPIAPNKEECLEIYQCARKNNCKVYVCHVLRYSPFYSTIKRIIDDNALGDIISIHASENVGYFHQAHSFVRGPWRNSNESCPMILAKCCHDMDILRYLIGEKCLSINSIGSLKYFVKENAPKESTEFCSDCKVSDCIYKAQLLYDTRYQFASYFTKGELTKENIMRDLKHSQYDRCIFKCDNNVVDHQSTILRFDNGKTATFTMVAFSSEVYRDIKIFGTKAELVGVMEDNFIELRPFGKKPQKINIPINTNQIGGHSGSDDKMMEELYKELNGLGGKEISYLDVSIESHLMSFAAEKSRLNNGATIEIEQL